MLIPDISDQTPPPLRVATRPQFTPPASIPDNLPAIATWFRQAAPELIFGAPDGWSQAPGSPTSFPVEVANIDRAAQIVVATQIKVSIQGRGDSAMPWSIQLRHYAGPLAPVVIQDPTTWAKAKSRWAEFIAPPIERTAAGASAVILRYAYEQSDVLCVMYETWLAYDGGGYHFIATGPAENEERMWPAWESILKSAGADVSVAAQPPAAPAAPTMRYRCDVAMHVPVTLENVANQQRSMVIVGTPSTAAWAAFAALGMRLYGNAKARGLEGKTVSVPAQGEAMLMDDRVVIRAVVDQSAAGVALRGDPAGGAVDLEIPFRIVRSCGTDSHGVWLDVVGRGAVWLQPQGKAELGQWLAHLSYNRTWQQPQALTVAPGPIAGWCQQDPRYTFGTPAGWAAPPAVALADYARLFQPSVIRCAVALDAGQLEAQVFVIEDGPWDGPVDGDSLAASILSATNISPVGNAQIIKLGSDTAALVRGTSWSSTGPEERCYGAVVHAGVRFMLWYATVGGRIGDGGYERYLTDFHTMLATWHWYR